MQHKEKLYVCAYFLPSLQEAPPIFMAQLHMHKETVALPAPTHKPTRNHRSAGVCPSLIQTHNTKHSAKKQSVKKRASVICYEQVLWRKLTGNVLSTTEWIYSR